MYLGNQIICVFCFIAWTRAEPISKYLQGMPVIKVILADTGFL